MSAADRMKALLFLALFSGASGALLAVLCCGTEYWLLAAESCSRTRGEGDRKSNTFQPEDGVTMFHQGLFWRCFFTAASSDFSILDFWIMGRPESKICQPAFLFPFPAPHPTWTGFPSEPYQPASAIVFRTFWSIFLVSGVTAVVIGGLLVLCGAPLNNRSLYSAGGALQICGAADKRPDLCGRFCPAAELPKRPRWKWRQETSTWKLDIEEESLQSSVDLLDSLLRIKMLLGRTAAERLGFALAAAERRGDGRASVAPSSSEHHVLHFE
ncbi:transmembrane protein 182-like isoform X1 [Poeciliopsis prolifica]|uniref:transmembrane protein 182-like isoform X1 n=1 Tax=Poeciliopsis prolifica TaxID=188132 RepID=UPI0024141454|nr:transmembrane protein 182-like isoform X1 [Poeciliopsis prolifica]